MLKRKFIFLLVAVLGMNAGYLSATVLTLYNVGSKAATMAGAFVGRADNTTAIYYNPAGLAFQKGLSFRVNVSYYNYAVKAELDEPHSFDQSLNCLLHFLLPIPIRTGSVSASAPLLHIP